MIDSSIKTRNGARIWEKWTKYQDFKMRPTVKFLSYFGGQFLAKKVSLSKSTEPPGEGSQYFNESGTHIDEPLKSC